MLTFNGVYVTVIEIGTHTPIVEVAHLSALVINEEQNAHTINIV